MKNIQYFIVIFALAFSIWGLPHFARAQSSADLQAQISELLRLVQQLQE